MRVCLQRVKEAWVRVLEAGREPRETGRVGAGLLALAGFAADDTPEAVAWMAAKIADLRVFEGAGESGFDRSLRDGAGELLVVSQFTLYGDARKGRRPDFGAAAPYGRAEALYRELVDRCETELPGRVRSGEFGDRMEVGLVNDGPVTLWIER